MSDENHTNVEAVSDERLAEIVAYVDLMGPNSQPCVPGDVARSMATELLSRRAANSAGGVEVADKSYRSPRQDAAYFGSVWSLSTNQMAELEKTFEYHRDHTPSFGADYPEGALSTEQSTLLDPLADREKSASPAAEAEPVAPTERLKLHRKIMGMIADNQRYAAVMIDGRELHVIAEALLDRAIEVERSSPVSAEVTEEQVERLARFIAQDIFGNSWDGQGAEGRCTDRGFKPFHFSMHGGMRCQGTQNDLRDVARAALAALNGGRENG